MNNHIAEIQSFEKIENGRLVRYSYSIYRDRNGAEVYRTRPTTTGASFGWGDGSEFTEDDYFNVRNGLPITRGKRSFLNMVINIFRKGQ